MRLGFWSDPNAKLDAAADCHIGKTDLLRVVWASFIRHIGVKNIMAPSWLEEQLGAIIFF